MKPLLLTWTLLALTASTASAQVVDLAWGQTCDGPTNEVFSCNVDTGEHILLAMFTAPAAMDAYVASTTTLDLYSDGPLIPDWWAGWPGGCSATRFSSLNPDGFVGCTNPYLGAVGFTPV